MPELTDLSYVRALCEKYDFALSKGFGQNFIVNPGLPPKIVDASGVDKRYGVIAEALVVDSKAGVKQSVKNEAFCARGGTSRRVFYVPARSGTQAMRYTGEYQIAKSKEGAETLRVTIAGRFTAAPGDIAAVSGTKIGIVGNFRVIECVRRFGESGEACEVTMQRE